MVEIAHISRGRATRKIVLSLAVFAVAGLALAGLGSEPSLAKEKKSIIEGQKACRAWCDAHNKTENSQGKCYLKCDVYWACNGSDSTEETCRDTKAAERPSPQLPAGMEDNSDRPGSDFGSFTVSPGSPAACQNACRKDSRCKAWTYVRPRIQGPSAVCYLKSAMPPAMPNKCCISGVVPRGPIGVSPNLPPPASQN